MHHHPFVSGTRVVHLIDGRHGVVTSHSSKPGPDGYLHSAFVRWDGVAPVERIDVGELRKEAGS